MKQYLFMLTKRKNQLKLLIDNLRERMKAIPEGSLYIKQKRNQTEYYHQLPSGNEVGAKQNWKRVYIPKGEMGLVKALAQKGYETELLKAAEKQYAAIEAFLRNYDPNSLKDCFGGLSSERKSLIDAVVLDDESFVKQWEAKVYPPSEFRKNDPEFYTKKGDRVRSKSEIIIADMLKERTIPYHYEMPHEIIKGEKLWRPDFTVLNVRERKEIIFEHLGRMDDPDYVRKNMWKFSQYLRNGYYPGDNLVFTLESSDRPLSMKEIELIIDRYFV